MGIEYTLVNHKNKTMFELGKGNYILPMRPQTTDEFALFLYREAFIPYFVEQMREHYDDWKHFDAGDKEKNLQYHTQLANTIFDFIEGTDPEKDLSVVNDCDDRLFELREQGYIFLGSRYTGMDDYHGYMLERNRRTKTSIDWSQIDFTWSMKRLRQLLVFM